MKQKDKILFNLLKNKVSERFLQEFPGTNTDISLWKGIEIVYFQEHLLKIVKANVSEKWFYTYFKQETIKLPRIDMLNLLSEYIGYKSWNHFILENNIEAPETITNNLEIETNNSVSEPFLNKSLKNNKRILINKYTLITLLAFISIIIIIWITSPPKYTFCFYNSETKQLINNLIEVSINKKGTTSEKFFVKESSCIEYSTKEDTLELSVYSKFYKPVTYKYVFNKEDYSYFQIKSKSINVTLEPDEYALMLNYYIKSTQKIKYRQNKLRNIISDKALIYQVYDNDFYAVEILTKEQYIGLLTLPTESLKNYIQIYSEKDPKTNKIIKIKFKINKS